MHEQEHLNYYNIGNNQHLLCLVFFFSIIYFQFANEFHTI
jgi:hypothetical protein